jgi:hypothetical protein
VSGGPGSQHLCTPAAALPLPPLPARVRAQQLLTAERNKTARRCAAQPLTPPPPRPRPQTPAGTSLMAAAAAPTRWTLGSPATPWCWRMTLTGRARCSCWWPP